VTAIITIVSLIITKVYLLNNESYNKMEIQKLCKELSNSIQIELLTLLKTKKNIKQIKHELNTILNRQVHRETIYNKLEKLVELSLIKKEYDPKTKRLVYLTISKKIEINLDKRKVNID